MPPRETLRLRPDQSRSAALADEDFAYSAEFNGEKITGCIWPTADNHLVVLELTY